MIPVSCWFIVLLLLISRTIASKVPKLSTQPKLMKTSENSREERNHHVPLYDIPHSRTKRLIWVTDDGRLALPPGTSLVIAPTLAMPFVRYPPDGFHSNISISIPLTIDFDKLGLTDNQNPLGTLGPLFARSISRSAGAALSDYVFKYLKHRAKRNLGNEFIKVNQDDDFPKLPENHKHAFHGGERAILYAVLEDFLSQFGIDGHNCVLRTICEVQSKKNIHQYGLIGEVMKLFFTASRSPFSELLVDYVEAEKIGKEVTECFPYFKKCPKSIFRNSDTMSYTKENSVMIDSKRNLSM